MKLAKRVAALSVVLLVALSCFAVPVFAATPTITTIAQDDVIFEDWIQGISYMSPLRSSIESRPADVAERCNFGHWEMDNVVGKAKGKSTCLLVLTERKTRQELMMKLPHRSTRAVVAALDTLQRLYGKRFSNIFKTITVDNGSEFYDTQGMEKGNRTKIYYCHPFSSWERGGNENANKLIRRFIPKGTPISKYTHAEIADIQEWINNYPRSILGGKASIDLFKQELENIAL